MSAQLSKEPPQVTVGSVPMKQVSAVQQAEVPNEVGAVGTVDQVQVHNIRKLRNTIQCFHANRIGNMFHPNANGTVPVRMTMTPNARFDIENKSNDSVAQLDSFVLFEQEIWNQAYNDRLDVTSLPTGHGVRHEEFCDAIDDTVAAAVTVVQDNSNDAVMPIQEQKNGDGIPPHDTSARNRNPTNNYELRTRATIHRHQFQERDIGGQGGRNQRNPFLEMVLSHRNYLYRAFAYPHLNRSDKRRVQEMLLDYILSNDGRVLRECKETGMFYIANRTEALYVMSAKMRDGRLHGMDDG